MRKKRVIIAVVLILILIIAFYIYFFYVKKCGNIECFNSAMSNCVKASYLNEANDGSWLFSVKKAEGSFWCKFSSKYCEKCIVNVKLLQAKKGPTDLSAIEGMDMNCELPMSYVGLPQADLSLCHGDLKEGIQDIVIKKMHSYILTNVGKIGEELTKAF
ncbi:hypothetical protein FJZ19_02540 [Candidatus Pacearchaeota archaeon]|nr:hypothetical protein [Candidatus Pacearchaeota archaeon]